MSLNRILCKWGEEAPDITTFTKSLKPEWIEEALSATVSSFQIAHVFRDGSALARIGVSSAAHGWAGPPASVRLCQPGRIQLWTLHGTDLPRNRWQSADLSSDGLTFIGWVELLVRSFTSSRPSYARWVYVERTRRGASRAGWADANAHASAARSAGGGI